MGEATRQRGVRDRRSGGRAAALVFAAAVVGTLWVAQPSSVGAEDAFDHSYALFGALLADHVDTQGRVDYQALSKDRRLAAFLGTLAVVRPLDLVAWSRAQRIAFYSNAYNALTLQAVVEALPLASIRDIRPDPWEDPRWTLAERAVSLNEIEHTILRRNLKEPRVHFVLVCAALSCPRLGREPLRPDRLDESLDGSARAFLSDSFRNTIESGARTIYLSSILDWYAADFVSPASETSAPGLQKLKPKERGVIEMIARYSSPELRSFLLGGGYSIAYKDYDWSLNSR